MNKHYSILTIVLTIILASASVACADYREMFKSKFLAQPWAGGQTEVSACVDCHTSPDIKDEFKAIPEEWRKSWHYQNDVSCHNCHGGNKDDDMPQGHSEKIENCAGSPDPVDIPSLCGKCHVGILENYQVSGHAKTLMSKGEAPSCVTCHGSHNIQKASIGIISEKLCGSCHSYGRAQEMKQALFATEKKIGELAEGYKELQKRGVKDIDFERTFFNTQVEFRGLFHATDVELIKSRTDEFSGKLDNLEVLVNGSFDQLRFRRNFSSFLLLLFVSLGIVLGMLSDDSKKD